MLPDEMCSRGGSMLPYILGMVLKVSTIKGFRRRWHCVIRVGFQLKVLGCKPHLEHRYASGVCARGRRRTWLARPTARRAGAAPPPCSPRSRSSPPTCSTSGLLARGTADALFFADPHSVTQILVGGGREIPVKFHGIGVGLAFLPQKHR